MDFDTLQSIGAFVLPGYCTLAMYEIFCAIERKNRDHFVARIAQALVFGILSMAIVKGSVGVLNHVFLSSRGLRSVEFDYFFKSTGSGFAPRLGGYLSLFLVSVCLGIVCPLARDIIDKLVPRYQLYRQKIVKSMIR